MQTNEYAWLVLEKENQKRRKKVSEVGKASVTFTKGDTWSMASIYSKMNRVIANKRNKVQTSSEPEKGEKAGKIDPEVKNVVAPYAEGSE